MILNTEDEFDFAKGEKSLEFGAYFTLDNPKGKYLLKVVAHPDKTVAFAAKAPIITTQTRQVLEHVIQTYMMLFKEI